MRAHTKTCTQIHHAHACTHARKDTYTHACMHACTPRHPHTLGLIFVIIKIDSSDREQLRYDDNDSSELHDQRLAMCRYQMKAEDIALIGRLCEICTLHKYIGLIYTRCSILKYVATCCIHSHHTLNIVRYNHFVI